MKSSLKKIFVIGTTLMFAGMVMLSPSAETKAAESDVFVEESGTLARVSVPEAEVYATVSRSAANGIVDGTGVRLRKSPSSTGTIIGLMDLGEYVDIYYSESTAKWYYLERIKNGTFGYASKQYILPF